MRYERAKGDEAARLRQRKYELARRLRIPDEALHALPGSLALTHRRCGRASCHCATEEKGHPLWSLTFMVDRRKRVERIPKEWVEEVRPLVGQGRELKDALAELLAINAQLLVLWRRQTEKAKKRR